jgi:hypothetical protein
MKYRLGFLAAVLFGAFATAGTIKVWSSGEYITATDLNAALAHLHVSVGHGHGPVIINSDVSGSAAIAHTKLATPALLPKAWGYVAAACATPATCTISDSNGITSIAGQATTGEYLVTLATTRSNANYAVVVSAYLTAQDSSCHATAQTTSTVTIKCITASTGADLDSGFSFMLLDSEN